MTFDHPLWLLLLLALPLLWWLHRRLRAPLDVVVASVDALRGVRLDAAARRPERRLDPELVLLLTATALLSCAAAGPRVGAAAPAVLVAVDTSSSMAAPAEPGGRLGEHAWDGALAALAAGAPGCDVVVVDLATPQTEVRSAARDAVRPLPVPPSADGLPASLAPVLARARAEGFPGVLLVTDRDPGCGPDVVVAGPGVAARRLPAILDVVLDDARTARVTLLRGAASELRLVVQRAPGGTTTIDVPPGEDPVVVSAPAPGAGQGAIYRLEPHPGGPGGDLPLVRRGGVRRVRLFAGEDGAPRVRALLAALGVEVVSGALAEVDADVVVRRPASVRSTGRASYPPLLHLAAAATRDVEIYARDASPSPTSLAGADVAASGVLAPAVPGPGAALVTTPGRIRSEGVVGRWTCRDGDIALAQPGRVVTTLDPEAEASLWHLDPSFPVFFLTAFEYLAGGPDRLESHGVPLSEIVRDGDPPPAADPARVAALVRPAAGDPASSSPAAALAVLAAGLVAVVVLRGAGLFSGARRRRVAAP